MPPREPPAAARPVALARLRLKKWPMEDMAGVKMREVPMPPRMPKTIMKCQYSEQDVNQGVQKRVGMYVYSLVQLPSKKMQRSRNTVPAATSSLGPLASNTGPICNPQKNDRKK